MRAETIVFYFLSAYLAVNCLGREGKFWPVGIVRFENSLCSSADAYQGVCLRKRQCHIENGTAAGTCAKGIGICCIYQRSCGSTSAHNNTYFVNSNYPKTVNGASKCTFTIRKCNPGICQVRLDFLNLVLAQPNVNGSCIYDSLTIEGGATNIAPICGLNTGQHMYINFNGEQDITITITTRASVSIARSWLIKAAQIGCDCPTLAPSGCLQYYTAESGTVNSFNYGIPINDNMITPNNSLGTRQMVNMNYMVCIRKPLGSCGIQWSEANDLGIAFSVSNNTLESQVAQTLPELIISPILGENCTTDYVVIPNPVYVNGTPVGVDRFCGNAFPTVISRSCSLTVVTDGDDLPDNANRGFSLNYQQVQCAN